MPPSPGRIQELPDLDATISDPAVKVLYSLDTISQSYVTVLPDKCPVYVHSLPPSQCTEEAGLGSCYLKAAVRGICFASPECIPNSTSLDFSVYNLDPTLRPARSTRAFPPSTPGPDDAWTGKGFLSWVLAEIGNGQTLVKGRLTRDHDFSPLAFNDQGGLEGLMAAAARAGDTEREDTDGRGWGLEVCVSLKMVNPEGKDEFKGRREFEDMLRRGTALASVSSPVRSGSITTTPRAQHQVESVRRLSSSTGPPPRVNTSAPGSLPPPTSNRPSPSSTTQPPPLRASTSTSRVSHPSPLNSSSAPLPSSSSTTGPPSRPPSRANGHPSSSTHHRTSSREITPPPQPRRKSPPPTTPSREKLAALLRTDDKMSPRLAKQLANHPVLLQLLKGVNPSAPNGSQNGGSSAKTPDSGDALTPTPVASTSVSTDSCCNCGATESELWRTKNMKDGTTKKVCNACGLYFNKNKRMRPPDLWGTNAHDDPAPAEKKARDEHHTPIRCSPRLHRQLSDTNPPQLPPVAESPRKRRKAAPQPSPRPSTRASTRLESLAQNTHVGALPHSNGAVDMTGLDAKTLDFATTDLFSPSTMFSTSPAQAVPTSLGMDGTALAADGELDIDALLSQIAAVEGTNGFSLDSLFAGATTGADGGEGNLMDLLTGWDDGAAKHGTHR